MAFSDTVQLNILAFAATMGIRLHPDRKGGYGFNIPGQGIFSLTEAHDGDRVIVSLSFPADHWGEGAEERLFALTQAEWNGGRLLSVGLNDDNVVFLGLSVDGNEISSQILDDCLKQLLSARAGLM